MNLFHFLVSFHVVSISRKFCIIFKHSSLMTVISLWLFNSIKNNFKRITQNINIDSEPIIQSLWEGSEITKRMESTMKRRKNWCSNVFCVISKEMFFMTTNKNICIYGSIKCLSRNKKNSKRFITIKNLRKTKKDENAERKK